MPPVAPPSGPGTATETTPQPPLPPEQLTVWLASQRPEPVSALAWSTAVAEWLATQFTAPVQEADALAADPFGVVCTLACALTSTAPPPIRPLTDPCAYAVAHDPWPTQPAD